jgi:hypothetical protein
MMAMAATEVDLRGDGDIEDGVEELELEELLSSGR